MPDPTSIDASASYFELFKEVLTGGVYDESAWRPVLSELILPEMRPAERRAKRFWQHLARFFLRRYGIALVRVRAFDRGDQQNGREWPLCGYTMIGRARLDHLQRCVETILDEGIAGDLIETGVWRGGSCMLMKAVLDARGARDRIVWVADSFRGLPPPRDEADGPDLTGTPFLAVSADQVRSNFARFGLLDERVRFLEGWFSETLPTAPIGPLALLRLDGDLYHSTRDALDNLYDRVSPGGFVIVDDYGAIAACRKAVHDFLAERGEHPALEKIDFTGVWWRKARAA